LCTIGSQPLRGREDGARTQVSAIINKVYSDGRSRDNNGLVEEAQQRLKERVSCFVPSHISVGHKATPDPL